MKKAHLVSDMLSFGGQNWRTMTFRWLTTYAMIFSFGVLVLLGLIEYSVTQAMESEVDSGLRWQLRYFDSYADVDLPTAIARRIAHGGLIYNHYGLFASDGRPIAGDLDERPDLRRIEHIGQSHESASGSDVMLLVGHDRKMLRAIAEVRPDGRILVAARTLTDVHRIHDDLLKAIVGGGIFCLSASLLGGGLLGFRQLQRVAAMRRTTVSIAAGDLSLRLPVTGRDELDMLAQLVNRMLEEVERLMNEVKLASDGIAHDLRTPLARMRFRLANAQADAEAHEGALASTLAAALEDVDGIINRFSAMLRIAELGTRQRRAGFAAVELQSMMENLCELYRALAEEKDIQLHVSLSPVDEIWADEALLFEACSNLLDNAIKFSPQGGHVHVCLERNAYGAHICFFDNGPGIPEEERSLVLGNYYRATNTRHISGSGLGLGIVAAILRLHDFALTIEGSEHGAVICVECWAHESGSVEISRD
ncbi:HAMP domain-containing sensor histidine kinase [Paraburkholderia bannensis]|uniref:HAMP domain-containing sensor histidine kinase n=1 Tax=Paraburkholderia bannensis TaxID=765414 RepID=UPI0005A64EE8|nr:HAMP domain-containing sensor histidine kinase [Paraburkholderia bannensis]